jgi:hypothetical protein
MELSFVSENSADSSYLVQELELALQQDGMPATALSLRPSSAENMDIGSILSVSFDVATHVLGPLGSMASLAKCILEVVKKNNTTIVIVSDSGQRVELPAAKISYKRIEKAIAQSARPKPKARSRA